jgi:hypothetical protein
MRKRDVLAAAALVLVAAPPAAAQGLPVHDAAAVLRLLLQYRQFQQYYDSYKAELEKINSGVFVQRRRPYWDLEMAGNSFDRVEPLVEALRSGRDAAAAYRLATAGRRQLMEDLGPNHAELSDSAVLVDLVDTEAQDAITAVGVYRDESGQLEGKIATLNGHLRSDVQSQSALLQRLLGATVLMNEQQRDTNRFLSDVVMLQALEGMGERNTRAYHLNDAVMRQLELENALGFMDGPAGGR